jgi:hypothetical protein
MEFSFTLIKRKFVFFDRTLDKWLISGDKTTDLFDSFLDLFFSVIALNLLDVLNVKVWENRL